MTGDFHRYAKCISPTGATGVLASYRPPGFEVDLNRRVRGNQTTIPSRGADVQVGQWVQLHDDGEPGTVWSGIVRSIEGPRVYVEVEQP